MRNISFHETKDQFRARKKHVTRRGNADGPTWKSLAPGNLLMGCEKCQGLGKGGKIVRMGPITILEVNTEPLKDIIRYPFREIPQKIDKLYGDYLYVSETVLEGFPQFWDRPQGFVDMFCEMNNCEPETEVTRVLFDYMEKAVK